MAAHSGGSVEWSSIIKPISMASYGPITKSDILNLVKAILKSENDILEHDESYEQFYMSFAALSADSISAQCSTICQNQMAQFTEATSILIRYILNRLEKCTNNEIKLLLPAIKGLCEGKSHIQDMDQVVLASILRNSKHPEHLKTNMTGNEKDSPKCEMKRSRSDLSAVIYQQLTTPFTETTAAAWAPLNEELTDCSQLFINANVAVMQANNAGDILLNVCSALPTLSKYYSRYEESAVHGKSLYLPLTYNDAIQIKSLLSQMSSDITILSLALSLPLLHPLTPSKICQLSQCAMSALYCAVMASISGSVLNMSSASSQKSSSGTITTATTTTSTSAVGTQTASSSTLGSGGGGTPQPVSQQKDNEEIIEDHARVIVDKALEIYSTIGNIFKNSARIHIYQNHLCMGSWLLISGIQGAMGASGSSSNLKQSTTATTSNVTNIIDDINKGKSPSRTFEQLQQNSLSAAAASISGRVNLFKVQQGFCVLNAAIARHSIQLLTDLIENLKIESRSGDAEVNGDKIPEPAGFDILGQYTSLQRIVRVLHSTTLQQLLTFLATISYRKACNLKRINIKNDGDQLHYSDSTTYFNETFSCSDGSETEEEDSDCFLGVWFKETLSPETNDEPIEQITSDKNCDTERTSALVSAKDEPHEYLELSVQIFTFLDKSLGGNHLFLNKYVRNGLSEQQMVLLANILKDLDRDSVRSEFEQSNNGGGTQWQTVMMHFTSSIGRYIHNLIAGALMNETLQSALLLNLGVSPYTQDTIWPMQVYSRTLSVLVQILLLKPPQEKEAACLSVWHRLVITLVEGVCNPQYHHLNAQQQSQSQQQPPPPPPPTTQSQLPPPTASSSSIDDFDDLNFEHAQLLLFLFHSLNLMQKKSILLLTAGGVIRCAEVFRTITPEKPLRDIQITLLSRLLLFLEYLMKHLYNAPTILLEQVRWNLFGVMSIDSNQKISDIINNKTKMMSFYRKDIEDKYRKHTIEPTMRPKFYSLTLIDSKIQQEFKLDGLAWNFILCTPDKLKYPLLIDALIDILSVVDIAMAKIQYQQLCSVHYCFNICWKLLLGLPPSTPHVESLLQVKTPNLHSLIWTIRCFHAVASSHYLIVNSLVKQGMYTKAAEQLWSDVTEHVSNTKVSLKLTTLGLDSFYKTFQIDNPRLSKILLIDAIVSHLYAIYRSEKDTVKVSKVNNASTSSSANISSASETSVDNLSATSINELTNTSTVVPASTSVSTTTDINTTTDDNDNKINKIDSNQLIHTPDLSKDVMIKLLNVFETIKECTFKIMSTNLSDSSASPNHIIESLISMSNVKNQFCNEIVKQLPTLMIVQNKDIISLEWRRKNLIINDENFSNVAFPVELHTINVIDAHLLEIYKHPQYSILLSLKHSMKSILNLIYYLLPDCKDDDKIVERLKTILVPMLFDIRTEYLYDITNKCLETLLDGDSNSDQYQFLSYSILLQHSYNLLIDYTELCTIQQQQQPSTTTVNLNMDESILHYILKFWEQLLEKPMGLKAMHDFFYKTKKGQLVDILLSFSNTTLSQLYSTKILQFFENLFQASDKPDSPFHLDELCACVSELGNVESYKLRDWLSHILLGPNNGAIGIESEDAAGGLSCTDGTIGGVGGAACDSNTNAISSGESSNVQTPTNMATVSAIPSITDQIVNQSELGLDPNAMEIDDEWSIGISGAAAAAAVVVAAAGSSSAVPINTSAAIRVLPSAPIPIPSASGVGGTTSVTTAANGSCGLSSTSGWQSSGVAVVTSGGDVGGIAGTTLNIKNRSGSNSPTDECLEKNSHLLQSLTKYIVSENRISSTVSTALFNALLQIGSNLLCPPPHLQDALEFSDILQVMITLADASLGKGHYALFSAAIEWLIMSKNHIVEKNTSVKNSIPFENIISLLRYMVDLLQGLGYTGSRGLIASWEDDIPPDIDECSDELGAEDDDSAIEDSDEDSLGNKLCTYAVTQREFMNQHWYHCHTCKMVDGVGVCSVCARVCHKNHDISYAKFGNFFCDCGAKEDNTCQALSRRTTTSNPSNITTAAAANAAAAALVVPTASGPSSSVSSSLTTISVPSSITLAATSSESLSLAAAASISTTLAASLTSSAAVAAAAASCSNALINHINVATSSVSTTTITTTTSTVITTQTPTTTATTTAATATTNQNLSNVNCRPMNGSSSQLQQSSNLHQRELLKIKERSVYIAKMIDDSKDKLHNTDHWKNVINCLFDFIEYLMPAIRANSEKYSTIGCHVRAKLALERLHNPEKTFTISDQIMVATLGSQEGAFENVRMSYAGEQGQTIRQLLSNNLVRRVALCCLASPHGKRQHLAVCHERGKVTILQLSALLKQADAAKRKLTLTRLASAPIPCTVLSLASNPANEDFLAVCGLKECHILTFSSSGATNEHIVLTPPFDTGNFIKRAIWLPGSQTMLALITADFIKIYELAEDTLSPQYYFLVPSGKIRECTFIYQSGTYYMLLFASSGYIYTQPLTNESLAKHGAFYVTNTLELDHPLIQDVNGQIGGGGVSIYYSHVLQILFFSYTQGKTFMAPLVDVNKGVECVIQLQTAPNTKNSAKVVTQPLCQWTEIAGHPGLICAMMQTSNNPVIFMLKPDAIIMQEIKAQSSKAKIMDMVAIRHSVSGVEKTTLILLCEDGSLRIYAAHAENTNYWLSSKVQPIGNQMYMSHVSKSTKHNKKHSSKTHFTNGNTATTKSTNNTTNTIAVPSTTTATAATAQPTFPVDFFEHCACTTEIEFGGNDILQIYNLQQLKNRLNSTGLYIASSRTNGFTMDITNNDSTTVLTGVRVQIGSQELLRAPQTITINGNRTINTIVQRARWFDIPLTRDESIASDKKLSITFGPSQDPESICIVDSVKAYVVNKDTFGWPDETDDVSTTNITSGTQTSPTNNLNAMQSMTADSTLQITPLDRMLTSMLEVLDCGLSLLLGGATNNSTDTNSEIQQIRKRAVDVASHILIIPTPSSVQLQTKCVLAALHDNRTAYNVHKDTLILIDSNWKLMQMTQICDYKNIDPELFYRIVLLIRAIAVARPFSVSKLSLIYNFPIIEKLLPLALKLYNITPSYEIPSSIVRIGLSHPEGTVHCLIEIIYAFAFSDPLLIDSMTKFLIQLLLDKSMVISHSAKYAMITLLRPKVKRKKILNGSGSGSGVGTPPSSVTPSTLTTAVATQPQQQPQETQQPPQQTQQPPQQTQQQHPQQPQPQSASEPIASTSNAEMTGAVGGAEVSNLGNIVSGSQIVQFDENLDTGAGPSNPSNHISNALLAMENFHELLAINQNADDAIIEIAIALSLQDNEQNFPNLQQEISNIQEIRGQAINNLNENLNVFQNNYNDAVVSAGGSDDEGSNVATDGSTLRTSPAEPAGSGGSESGGSCVESIGGTSGRSSTYGDQLNTTPARISNIEIQQTQTTPPIVSNVTDHVLQEEPEEIVDVENVNNLHVFRVAILQKLIDNMPSLDSVSGHQAIPYLQVILMLTIDLDCSQEGDQIVVQNLVKALVERLDMSQSSQMVSRTPRTEVQLVILRLVGVFMGKVKSSKSSSSHTSTSAGALTSATPVPTDRPHSQFKDTAAYIAQATANALTQGGALQYCSTILKTLLPNWESATYNDDGSINNNSLLSAPSLPSSGGGSAGAAATPVNNILKATKYGPELDMQPIFIQNTKGINDVFELYLQVLTEMTVRLPYQIFKLSSEHPSTRQDEEYVKINEHMAKTLCQYMMILQSATLRRQVRKLLMYMCGSKEKYREIRDFRALNAHFDHIRVFIKKTTNDQTLHGNNIHTNPALSYDALVELTEHLRACQEVASARPGTWQRFCFLYTYMISSLIRISCYQLDEVVSPIILQLLQAAVCNANSTSSTIKNDVTIAPPKAINVSVKSRHDREKSEEGECSNDSKFNQNYCSLLVRQIFTEIQPQMLTKFIKLYLLETNITAIRWQAHSLLYALYENSNGQQKEQLLNSMWGLWSLLPQYGRRTAQFVDLLGYLTLNMKFLNDKLPEYMSLAISVLRQQNEFLSKHPNGPLYTSLGYVLELDGFYLESEPCLVCNNPEIPMSNIKLSSIKIDSKFTTTTTIVKLVQSHTISKIALRIADLKRTKMVRTINIYYNNRTVQAVVELKNRPSMWHKARKVTLQSGQIDVKIEFPLPITACNLMIEYSDFYETVTGSSESLQCPRCSAAVPSNPGVCSNCGENVFQCHKCRAINYDEKDPFLCHSCGYCKYAKFDYTIYGRVCCAVDPIESADDRAKTCQTIHSSLEKADRVYRALQANKQILELLVQKVSEHKLDRTMDETVIGNVVGTSQVNKVIQLLAQKYCVESKTSFEELSKIIQKVQACRRELVAYDRSQMDLPITAITASSSSSTSSLLSGVSSSSIALVSSVSGISSESIGDVKENKIIVHNRCYGCALASTEQCLTLLRAMASNMQCRVDLCKQGLVEELSLNNLRRGSTQIQDEVRQLLCLLTNDLPDVTQKLCNLIEERVKLALSGIIPLANIDIAVRHEMSLLESLLGQYDSGWEIKLKTVLKLFIMAARDVRGPPPSVIQPTLRILESLLCPLPPKSKINKDLSTEQLCTIKTADGLTVNCERWIENDKIHSFEEWKSRMQPIPKSDTDNKTSVSDDKTTTTTSSTTAVSIQPPTPPSTTASNTVKPDVTKPKQRIFGAVLEQKRLQYRHAYLMEKYAKKWRNNVLSKDVQHQPLQLEPVWLQKVLFNQNSRLARQLICSLVPLLINKNHERHREILNVLNGFLKYVGESGEACDEFLLLYRTLAENTPWRQYLVLQGTLLLLADLLNIEIEKIHRLEETTLSSDLAQGYALRHLVELMSMFLDKAKIRQVYKGKLLGPVLQGYLSLRKLVVQRTRLVDDAQEKLLEMLEEMTTGTEDETRAFMVVLIETVQRTSLNDIKTPVFIFERLCSIIHPEENDVGEFFLTLEKDPQQEDFLQGRMLGNPYPSTEAGLGPLMRDVKNKICMDCELVALLEDDNGMELLVYNKIISLDLPVKDVYKKVWLAEGGERDTMRIVYRMRGLLGDATEEFIETLNNKSTEEIDNEKLYCMANVLAECGGLKVMLDRIVSLQNVSRSRSLLQVLLKLFLMAVKVRRCQDVLCLPELGAINTLLKVLQLCLQSDNDSQQSAVTEQLLEIMETILSKAASDTLDSFLQFSLTFGGPEYVTALISCTNCVNVRNNPSVLRHLIRVLAALVYGNDIKMGLLCEHFKDTLDFSKFDVDNTHEDHFKMELFCVLTNQIEHNSIGGTLKDYIISLGIVEKALNYIVTNAPCVKPTLLRTDSDELKEFLTKHSLKYVLRFLTGLTTKHEPTQIAIAKDIIPIIHRLEQVSSDEHVGSLAENLLEALCTDPMTAERVQEVRDFTRAEKKRLAMATRVKQLDALGMRTNEKGQVTAKGSILQKMEKLRDETGLTCFICREGYACQPTKVLGIYTFTKRTNIEEYELKPRKTLGYTTVTYFNVVHIDCHMSAIRLARGRDEWESASLQNANTRCNGLLPLFGPDISETAFSSCMSRHNTYMQESTQRCEITFNSGIHDLKLLLLRFAQEKTFHDDAGGGGPQSNMHLVPYLLFYSLYMLLSTRSFSREERLVANFVRQTPAENWLECAYDVEGPLYQIILSIALHTPEIWKRNRLQHLKRLIVCGHVRYTSPSQLCKALSRRDCVIKNYASYKPYIMFWALVDLIYRYLFKTVTTPKEEDWPISLFDYIRRNDESMLKATDLILQTFTEEYIPCTSFAEFCDVAELLNDIENPDTFLTELLLSLPSLTA